MEWWWFRSPHNRYHAVSRIRDGPESGPYIYNGIEAKQFSAVTRRPSGYGAGFGGMLTR